MQTPVRNVRLDFERQDRVTRAFCVTGFGRCAVTSASDGGKSRRSSSTSVDKRSTPAGRRTCRRSRRFSSTTSAPAGTCWTASPTKTSSSSPSSNTRPAATFQSTFRHEKKNATTFLSPRKEAYLKIVEPGLESRP